MVDIMFQKGYHIGSPSNQKGGPYGHLGGNLLWDSGSSLISHPRKTPKAQERPSLHISHKPDSQTLVRKHLERMVLGTDCGQAQEEGICQPKETHRYLPQGDSYQKLSLQEGEPPSNRSLPEKGAVVSQEETYPKADIRPEDVDYGPDRHPH